MRCFRCEIFHGSKSISLGSFRITVGAHAGIQVGHGRCTTTFGQKYADSMAPSPAQYRRAIGGLFVPAALRLPACGIGAQWRVFTWSVVRTPARRGGITERTFRAMAAICVHAGPWIHQLEFTEVYRANTQNRIDALGLRGIACAGMWNDVVVSIQPDVSVGRR